MARPKKIQKVKEPVRIRQRKLANGNMSLYLDVYVKGGTQGGISRIVPCSRIDTDRPPAEQPCKTGCRENQSRAHPGIAESRCTPVGQGEIELHIFSLQHHR